MISSVIRTCFPAAAKVVADKAEDINRIVRNATTLR